MTNDLEDLIRTVQLRAADTAEVGTLREGIAARASSLRRRRAVGAVVAAAVAVVVAAVAIPLATATHRSAPASVPSAAPSNGTVGAALRYRMTQPPSGFTERSRIIADPAADNPEIVVVRSWDADPVLSTPSARRREINLFVQRRPDPSYYQHGDRVLLNGSTPGWYENRPDDPSSTVSWLAPAGDVLLQVRATGLVLPEDTLLRTARSVRPDPATTRFPLSVPWLPPGYTPSSSVVQGDGPAAWQCSVFATSDPQDAPDSRYSLTVSLGASTDAPMGGPLVMVGGRPARVLDGNDNSRFLVVNLDDGLLLTVSSTWPANGAPPSDADLDHVATASTRSADPTVTAWIGAG